MLSTQPIYLDTACPAVAPVTKFSISEAAAAEFIAPGWGYVQLDGLGRKVPEYLNLYPMVV